MAFDASQNLIAYLNTSTAVRSLMKGGAHENKVPQSRANDYVWFRQTNREYVRTLDEAAGTPPKSIFFDVECCSTDLNRACDLAAAVRDLFPFSGTFGESTTKGAFANDQSEDYLPTNEMADDGIHAQSLQLEIMP